MPDTTSTRLPFSRIVGTFSRLVAATYLVVCLGAQHAPAQNAPPPAAPSASLQAIASEAAEMAAIARQRGHVRVIVQFASPVPPGDIRPDPAIIANVRARIAALQDGIIARHFGNAANPAAGRGFARGIHRFGITPGFAVNVSQQELEALAIDPAVIRIQYDRPVPPTLIQSVPLIGMTNAYALNATGQGQAVVVLDTGVQASHEFLAGRVVAEACFSNSGGGGGAVSLCPNGAATQTGAGAANPNTAQCINGSTNLCVHGTHVAGIAGGSNTSQSTGEPTSGVAKSSSIVGVQIFSRFNNTTDCGGSAPCVLTYTSDQISGLEYAFANINLPGGVTVASVNMSLGGGRDSNTCDNSSLKSPIDSLRAAGVLTAIASGNNGYTSAISSPGCISTALTVGSTTKTDTISSFSNMSSVVDVLAPGGSGSGSCALGGNNNNILASVPNATGSTGTYACLAGTSMATPHVAGAIAAIRAACPSASADAIENALISTGTPVTDTRPGGTITKNRIRVDLAVQMLCATFTINVSASPSAGGSVSGGGTFAANSSRTVTASANSGYTFANWTENGNVVSTSASYTFTLTANRNLVANFTGVSVPTVTSVSPSSGSTAGGTSVIISGANFTGATSVSFGGSLASITSVSANSITATTPAHAAGSVSVVVTTPAGSSTGGPQFTYINAATTTAVASSAPTSTFGQSVTFTATVTSGGGTPTGTVTFKDGSTTLGTGTLSGGSATFSTAALSAGSHSITAVYGGDSNFGSSTSAAVTQTVNKAATTTKLVSSRKTSVLGRPVTFTATVTSSGGTPTGTVTIYDGPSVLGTSTLSAGAASFTTTSLSVGKHIISASYDGNNNFGYSEFWLLKQRVISFTTVHNFSGGTTDGALPRGDLILDQSGALYGATLLGGAQNQGVVFKLSPPVTGQTRWTEDILHSFAGGVDDGSQPAAGLTADASGALYGATSRGGPSDLGTVYKLSPPPSGKAPWTKTTLHSFAGSNDDGAQPAGALTADRNGALYGTTSRGGPSNQGTVFKLTPPAGGQGKWTKTILHSFAGSDGAQPLTGVRADAGGALYGTTSLGGSSNQGTVFKLTPPAGGQTQWVKTILHSFAGGENDGAQPVGGVTADRGGTLYGTTSRGGRSNQGVVFKLTQPASGQTPWTMTILHNFAGGLDAGAGPLAGPFVDSDGALYGTTSKGGIAGTTCGPDRCGIVYAVTPPDEEQPQWDETALYFFTGASDGGHLTGGLVAGPGNALYGATGAGGPANQGTVFKLVQ